MYKENSFLLKMSRYEISFCSSINGFCRHTFVKLFFSAISRLGDGVFWYTLILAIPFLYGADTIGVSLHLASVGIAGLIVYKIVKHNTERPRPYTLNHDILLGGRVLDLYSFPSGHTLHATSFTCVTLSYFPELAWALIPFSALVATSRVVLGLHYPTDVLCGALIGLSVSSFSLIIWGTQVL